MRIHLRTGQVCTLAAIVASPLLAAGGSIEQTDFLFSDHEASRLTLPQRQVLERMRDLTAKTRLRLQFCFAPGTPIEYVMELELLTTPAPGYIPTDRWPGNQGDPLSLTYSFVPDGVFVPPVGGIIGGGDNSLNAMLTGIFGSPEAGHARWTQMFSSWSNVAGLSYAMVNDDGAPLYDSPGSETRGDIRVSATSLDGPGGILAYNNFPLDFLVIPGGGDQVLDADDAAYFGDPANDYLFLRNTITHEHGHGMGLMHVCPVNETKLMEPYISLLFDGQQHDDIRGAQRHYGDPNETNDSAGSASALGAVDGERLLTPRSIDDNADVDYYAVDLLAGDAISITVTPVGFTYQSGSPLLSFCLSPTTVNSLTIHNLDLALLDTDGSSVLSTSDTHPAGQAESITEAIIDAAGTYFVRVTTASSTDDVQLYELTISVDSATPLCDGDANGDGTVDPLDSGYVLSRLSCPVGAGDEACDSADVNTDGLVDPLDAGYVLSRFGQCF